MRLTTITALVLASTTALASDDLELPPDAPPPAPPAVAEESVVADEPAPAAPAAQPARAWAALTVGAIVPQAFNRLGFAASPELSGGAYLLDGRLGLGGTLSYAQPSHTRTLADPRVPAGSYSFTLTTRDLRIGVGAQWHFKAASEKLSPYAGARVKLHLVGSTTDGTAGSAFGEHSEQSTTIGGAPYGGLLYRVGPGALVGELEVDLAPINQRVTGDANISALAFKVGYGMVF